MYISDYFKLEVFSVIKQLSNLAVKLLIMFNVTIFMQLQIIQ